MLHPMSRLEIRIASFLRSLIVEFSPNAVRPAKVSSDPRRAKPKQASKSLISWGASYPPR